MGRPRNKTKTEETAKRDTSVVKRKSSPVVVDQPDGCSSKYFKSSQGCEDEATSAAAEHQDETDGGDDESKVKPSKQDTEILDADNKQDNDVTKDNAKSKSYTESFYNQPCVALAKALLGKVLVRQLESGERVSGKIVETEAYLGFEDKAAHSYKGKRTERNKAMFMDPGTAYVYHIYGMYTCMNISSEGEGAAVLLRAVEPVDGLATMRKLRSVNSKDANKILKEKDLGNGPSKLTQALSIDKPSVNQQSLTNCKHTWVEPGDDTPANEIISCSRIGINYAEEWTSKPLRFYVRGNIYVSKRDRAAEKQQEQQSE